MHNISFYNNYVQLRNDIITMADAIKIVQEHENKKEGDKKHA